MQSLLSGIILNLLLTARNLTNKSNACVVYLHDIVVILFVFCNTEDLMELQPSPHKRCEVFIFLYKIT